MTDQDTTAATATPNGDRRRRKQSTELATIPTPTDIAARRSMLSRLDGMASRVSSATRKLAMDVLQESEELRRLAKEYRDHVTARQIAMDEFAVMLESGDHSHKALAAHLRQLISEERTAGDGLADRAAAAMSEQVDPEMEKMVGEVLEERTPGSGGGGQ